VEQWPCTGRYLTGPLEALQATHRAGIVHRDVKPSNVQLCGGLRVVLTDFGIASTAEDGSDTSTGKIIGSPAYMAPEQVHGGEFEPASDLFSLGATLYAAVEGRSPFGKGCPAATLSAIVTEPPAPLRRAGPLGPVIEGLLAKDSARRLGPDQARGALRAIQRGESPPRIQVRPRARGRAAAAVHRGTDRRPCGRVGDAVMGSVAMRCATASRRP